MNSSNKKVLMIVPILILVVVLSSLVFATTNNISSSNSNNSTASVNTFANQYYIFGNLTGHTQGQILGTATEKGYENQLVVLSYSVSMVQPVTTTGTPSGAKMYSAFKITMDTSRASPLLALMFANNELFVNAVFNFVRPISDGTFQNYYRIKLNNAFILSIAAFGNSNGNFETYSLGYTQLILTNLISGSSVTLDNLQGN